MNEQEQARKCSDYVHHAPISGRFVVRLTGTQQSALVGILHFPKEFEVRETALYLLMFVGDGSFVVDFPIDDGFPAESRGNGVAYTLQDKCWRGTSVAGTLTVRFLKAFPESNGWVVYGPAQHPVVPSGRFAGDHAWQDVAQGCLSSITPPFEAAGESVAGLLTSHAVWPDALGRPHALPAMESTWRKVYLRRTLLLASMGAAEISEKDFTAMVRNDPELFHIRDLLVDHEYARYLARLRELGGISEMGVRTADELANADALARQAIRETLLASH